MEFSSLNIDVTVHAADDDGLDIPLKYHNDDEGTGSRRGLNSMGIFHGIQLK